MNKRSHLDVLQMATKNISKVSQENVCGKFNCS